MVPEVPFDAGGAVTNVRGGVPRKSHVIPCGHFVRSSKNVGIPVICVHGLKHSRGNYVRNCFGSSPSSPVREPDRWLLGPFDAHVGPMACIWALSPAREPDEMCVGGFAHVHVEGLTCVSRGSRACLGVRVRITHHVQRSCAQNADHLAHNSPLSPIFAEVVCTLASTSPHVVAALPPLGGNGTT